MKSFFVWAIRLIGTIIVVFIVPGIVNALTGGQLTKTMSVIAWPMSSYIHIMPVNNSWDGWKWAYAGITVTIEALFVLGILALSYEVIRLGRSKFSGPSLRSMARMLAQIELSVRNAWGLEAHECRFYWLAGKKKSYDYYSNHQPLNDLDARVIESAILKRQTFVSEARLRQQYLGHPAYEYAFIQNVGQLAVGMIVFINRPGIVTRHANEDAFRDLVEPIVSADLDGTKEIVVELSKWRGVIVV